MDIKTVKYQCCEGIQFSVLKSGFRVQIFLFESTKEPDIGISFFFGVRSGPKTGTVKNHC